MNLLADIQEKESLTYIVIAHDLAMLQHITTHIAVMYLGRIVEMGKTEEVFSNPLASIYQSALCSRTSTHAG